MDNIAENKVSNFYNTIGWEEKEGISEDSRRWEDLREYAQEYVQGCRLRVLKHIPDSGENILDMASGPIQYKEYLEYSRNYKKRYCVDLSSQALESAKEKIGEHGVFLCGSFFDINLSDNFFDCSISLHTIFHIDKDKQEEAVRKLIQVTKPNKPVIIVYSNPKTIVRFFLLPLQILRKIKHIISPPPKTDSVNHEIYFYAHPIKWWERFSDVSDVKIFPWRSFASDEQKKIIPNNKIGKVMLKMLFFLEDKFPNIFVQYFQYPMIILKKI